MPKKDDEEVANGEEQSSSSSKFDDVFDVNYAVPPWRSQRTKGDGSSKEKGIICFLP